ncbi:MAG: hypothetical protein LLF87_00950 [Eubacteriales bacterium]|nr:hypothetical protein [Eubacteriales bacterium]
MKLIRYKKALNIAWYALFAVLAVMTFLLKSSGVCYLTFAARLKSDPLLIAYLIVFAVFAATTVFSLLADSAAKKEREREKKD